jgi:DNA excision repair protein ERCC-4
VSSAVAPELCPFTILVDSAEQQPWTFRGFKCDAAKKHRPLEVRWKWQSLGRHPNGTGDYSIEGFENRIGIERKSVDDCRGTILGWPKTEDGEELRSGRRDRFKQELENLSHLESACVVVEGTLEDVVLNVPDHGTKTQQTQAKILFRSIVSFQQDYPVQWVFCDGKRWAETFAFRWMERFWRHHK